MAERTTSNPLAMLTLANWRDTIAGWIGVSYDSISADAKVELNRYIDEGHEYAIQRQGHNPWAKRQALSQTTDSNGQIVLPADVRHILSIREVGSDGNDTAGIPTTIETYYQAAGSGQTPHPWTQQSVPRWYFVSMDDQNPPQQIWQRRPIPESTVTVDFLYRPYLGLLADDAYAGLPADIVRVIRHDSRSQWAAFTSNYEKANAERALREDAIGALQTNDAPDGIEALIAPQPSSTFFRELQ